MITETHIQLINDMYKYDEGGLINGATGVENKGAAAGGRYKCIVVAGINLYVCMDDA